jgi:hypothetical protein
MSSIYHFTPITREHYLKITILKSMSYCGVVWGLYHEGWAMMRDSGDYIFPFWLTENQAQRYAQLHWPNYTPKRIHPSDFKQALIPTLTRLHVKPALCHAPSIKLKLTAQLMEHMFFNKAAKELHYT